MGCNFDSSLEPIIVSPSGSNFVTSVENLVLLGYRACRTTKGQIYGVGIVVLSVVIICSIRYSVRRRAYDPSILSLLFKLAFYLPHNTFCPQRCLQASASSTSEHAHLLPIAQESRQPSAKTSESAPLPEVTRDSDNFRGRNERFDGREEQVFTHQQRRGIHTRKPQNFYQLGPPQERY